MIFDLGSINSIQELHLKLKTALGFPNDYGMNWESFWDCIQNIDGDFDEVTLRNWKAFEQGMPSDAEIFKELISDFNRQAEETEIAIEQVF